MYHEEVKAEENQVLLRINSPQWTEMGDRPKVSRKAKNLLIDREGVKIQTAGLVFDRENVSDAGNSMGGDGLQKPDAGVGIAREGDAARQSWREGEGQNWSDLALNLCLPICAVLPVPVGAGKANLLTGHCDNLMQPGRCGVQSLFSVLGHSLDMAFLNIGNFQSNVEM